MRVISLAKAVALMAAIALTTGVSGTAFAAPKMQVPPGACVVMKKAVLGNGAVCSFDCNPANGWCSQQICVNGQLTQIINCYGTFCSPKCGG